MTEEKKTHRLKQQLARGSFVVVPLLFICCAALAGFMALGGTILSDDSGNAVISTEPSNNPDDEGSTPEQSNTTENTNEEVEVSSFTAVSSSEEVGRVENIRLAAEAIDGTVIEPGTTFSFNATVGDTEKDDRYLLAPIVSDDEMVYGQGGGVCQVSSALYVAALYTELRIAERHPHSVVVDYTPVGLDATVVYGIMDLQIANDSEFPMTISVAAEGQSVTVKFLGQPLEEGILVEPISELIEYHVAGTPVQNALEWNYELENTTYYVVESYREYYYQGTKAETVLLARDTYELLEDSSVRMPNGSLNSTK